MIKGLSPRGHIRSGNQADYLSAIDRLGNCPFLSPTVKKSLLVSLLVLLALGAFFCVLRLSQSNSGKLCKTDSLEAILRLIHADPASTPVYGYEIVNSYPHDPKAYTQGLILDEGFLYESTGLCGESTLRKIELETGKLLRIQHLADHYFGEGLTLWQDKLIQLTWKSGDGFIYNKKSFLKLKKFHYDTEVWGITHDGSQVIVSDGTATLRFLDPNTFLEIRRIEVRDRGIPILCLNELEYVKGEVYANVWGIDYIARIAPETGQVLGWINLSGLRSTLDDVRRADALNGIAYDAASARIFVTGKRWAKLFEIQLNPND